MSSKEQSKEKIFHYLFSMEFDGKGTVKYLGYGKKN